MRPSPFFDPKKWKKLPMDARARVLMAATVAPSKPSRSNTANPAAKDPRVPSSFVFQSRDLDFHSRALL